MEFERERSKGEMVRQSKRRRGNSGDAVAEDATSGHDAAGSERGAGGASPSENVGGDANAHGGAAHASGAAARKSDCSGQGARTGAEGIRGTEEVGAEAFFASLEVDSIENMVNVRAKVLEYLEERARAVSEKCDEIESSTDRAVHAIENMLRANLIRIRKKIRSMSMREFRREFGNMEELAPILGDFKGRDTNPENSPMEDAGVPGDAPLGEHGTVVSGMETDMGTAAGAAPCTPPDGTSSGRAVNVPGTALVILNDKPAALGEEPQAATLAFDQLPSQMDDKTKQQTKQQLLDMQKQIDALMNQLA